MYFIYPRNKNLTAIFEKNQADLERAVDNLAEMFLKPVNKLKDLKINMLDASRYVENRWEVLLKFA